MFASDSGKHKIINAKHLAHFSRVAQTWHTLVKWNTFFKILELHLRGENCIITVIPGTLISEVSEGG
jgi:hypothetical protein